ncbi:MAG TPA: cupredoxin domain-containing protein [Acetobacteraceae bacterium]|nr:cupredoxin domain-containing protein [Acetobacteraceae bacterium]
MPRRFLPALAAILLGLAPVVAVAAAPPITLMIQNHRFVPSTLVVPAHRPVQILVRNLDPTAEEFDSSSLKIEKVFAGRSQGTLFLHPLAPGRYRFQGEYHPATATGVVVAK